MEGREPSAAEQPEFVSRKEKRKALKKDKRKQIRKELAEKARAEEEARINDPEEQRRIQVEEEREKERLERDRKEFEERERIFLEELQRKKMEEEEEERRNVVERELKLKQEGVEEGSNEDDEWEYVEEGPPEIIWQGNEIIVKKNKVRVKKKDANQHTEKEDPNRPTSNPLPPQSEAYDAYKNAPMTSVELLDSVAQQVPNFGTEQDKSHCPFHIKTGACRFGLRCNRVHYYPDKSSTLLIKNMYNGPGLAWEQDEGLEYTEEEVEHSYEEFYEDVHTEFLKFGEIINFKVCRNGSFHLRGNVYVNYKSLDSAVMAHNSVHGRYFAGKQVKCEFVSLTKWKVAICGEYMKSRLKTCSRGSACNFLHCFSNPGGDYEWADCDKPPPRYWAKKMTALFGYSDDSWHAKQKEQPSPKDSKIFTSDRDGYHSKRRRSIQTNQHDGGSGRSRHEENHARKSRHHEQQKDDKSYEDETEYKKNHRGSSIAVDTDSGGDRNTHRRHRDISENRSRHNWRDYDGRSSRTHGSSSDEDLYMERRHVYKKRRSRHRENISESSNDDGESGGAKHEPQWQPSSDPSETELQKHKERKTNSARYHRRSRRHDDKVDHRQSQNKQKRRHRKSASLHRYERSRSRDSGYLSDKDNDRSERWDPDGSPNEHGEHRSNKVDYEKSEDRETRSGSLEEESKSRQIRDRKRI
ncbi:zinc finger CCCH domain-containing protein 5 [Cynara cardunculus var. scolymus]|uniref:zinc finger CCCH domain-containing protein 5 n=1 Tax=Cynara cardunculus var. scolymus TaxID=59895 RepID=UPI000D62BD02|nr:zinc finger CCCH domain-containing protein 5 [Cynara cardunculus var. scolymus]